MSTELARTGDEIINLNPYEEIIGFLETCSSEDGLMTIQLSSGTLQYDSDSLEAEICSVALTGMEGNIVSILYTSIPDKPLCLVVEEPKVVADATRETAAGEDGEVNSPDTTQLALDDRAWSRKRRMLRT